ncbi:MAG: copper chaperone PCu(A)C [Paraglaciecola sp.]|nr:copper chaperone PCu(A)C [Paraglaciecola sp.]
MLRLIIILCSLVTGMLYAETIITNATVRLLPPGVPNTAAYFSIQNNSDTSQTLIAVSADFATKAEIHNHIQVGDMMRMQHQSEVVIEPGESIQFAPGGLHIMLFGLKQPLREEQSVSIILQTKEGESISITANVARPTAHSTHSHH